MLITHCRLKPILTNVMFRGWFMRRPADLNCFFGRKRHKNGNFSHNTTLHLFQLNSLTTAFWRLMEIFYSSKRKVDSNFTQLKLKFMWKKNDWKFKAACRMSVKALSWEQTAEIIFAKIETTEKWISIYVESIGLIRFVSLSTTSLCGTVLKYFASYPLKWERQKFSRKSLTKKAWMKIIKASIGLWDRSKFVHPPPNLRITMQLSGEPTTRSRSMKNPAVFQGFHFPTHSQSHPVCTRFERSVKISSCNLRSPGARVEGKCNGERRTPPISAVCWVHRRRTQEAIFHDRNFYPKSVPTGLGNNFLFGHSP